jgi:thiopurine S-methyltransferase
MVAKAAAAKLDALMDNAFWLERWQRNELGFQLDDAHPLLVQCLSQVLSGQKQVFVPLCGKSPDMWYLAQFLRVVGAELSSIACQAFFAEQGMSVSPVHDAGFQRYEQGNICLWQGDYFALTKAAVAGCELTYDRAALIALPPDMRQRYAGKLMDLLPAGAKILLISLEYPQHEKQGPPFSVPENEIAALFKGARVDLLATLDITNKGFARRRFETTTLYEKAYCITLPH